MPTVCSLVGRNKVKVYPFTSATSSPLQSTMNNSTSSPSIYRLQWIHLLFMKSETFKKLYTSRDSSLAVNIGGNM